MGTWPILKYTTNLAQAKYKAGRYFILTHCSEARGREYHYHGGKSTNGPQDSHLIIAPSDWYLNQFLSTEARVTVRLGVSLQ